MRNVRVLCDIVECHMVEWKVEELDNPVSNALKFFLFHFTPSMIHAGLKKVGTRTAPPQLCPQRFRIQGVHKNPS